MKRIVILLLLVAIMVFLFAGPGAQVNARQVEMEEDEMEDVDALWVPAVIGGASFALKNRCKVCKNCKAKWCRKLCGGCRR